MGFLSGLFGGTKKKTAAQKRAKKRRALNSAAKKLRSAGIKVGSMKSAISRTYKKKKKRTYRRY